MDTMKTTVNEMPAADGLTAADEVALRDAVREHYAGIARTTQAKAGCGCGCSTTSTDQFSSGLYEDGETAGIPADAIEASLGCGNPSALAELRAGEVVLDLGSGAGLDVLLSARRVGPTGKAYGIDMTDEMLALARRNQEAAGIANAEFLRGHLEAIPLPEGSVDVVISNCVVNLSPDKDRTLAEAFRVLRPGGRLAISDVVVEGEVPPKLRRVVELWGGCIAGALSVEDYRAKLAKAGFVDGDLELTRVYDPSMLPDAARQLIVELGVDLERLPGRFAAAFVRATKPVAAGAAG
jgi:arsenite methyltransferase